MLNILIKSIIHVGLKGYSEESIESDKAARRLLRELGRIEFGVAVFCRKLSIQAKSQGDTNLADMLLKHANSEERHGKMLGSLADGSARLRLDAGNGMWVEIKLEGETDLIKPIESDRCFHQLSWNSTRYPGKRIFAKMEHFDGISQRYLALRILFDGKKPESLSWKDKLAFMAVLEDGTRSFYMELAKQPGALGAIASQIAEDEEHHANYLKSAVGQFSSCPLEEIRHWQKRVAIASIFVLFDLFALF
jgi:rubrerythrin